MESEPEALAPGQVASFGKASVPALTLGALVTRGGPVEAAPAVPFAAWLGGQVVDARAPFRAR
jgi:hypothetical protein